MKQIKKPHTIPADALEGLLVAHFGASAEVEDAAGNVFRCHLRKNADPVITGDKVFFEKGHDGTGIILEKQARKSLLAKPENPKKTKYIAANIDAMIIVCAPPPILSEYLIDRYLVAAENLNIKPIILLNKMDLLSQDNQEAVINRLMMYKKIGYEVLFSSTLTAHGLDDFDQLLKNKTCVLVGTSGVGKSSIIAKLLPEQTISVGETSAAGLGKHTTTSTRLYHLAHGGNLIDSPGIREFTLWNVSKKDITKGFIEFAPFVQACRFSDCQHQKEPGCALQKALEDQLIFPARFQSYLDMIKGQNS